ncbi:hypothetical protein HNR74_004427 [Flammeovirga kamogawensis]|nr:hypothetical protein [Flammeovirga kamogawensis]
MSLYSLLITILNRFPVSIIKMIDKLTSTALQVNN